jgi:hypothetical protein
VLERHLGAPAVGREAPVVFRAGEVVKLDSHVVRSSVQALRWYRREGRVVVKKTLSSGRLEPFIDTALRDLYRKLLPLLQPPADPPKRRIGFHTDKDQ